jgi:hypothetical protein
MDYPGSCSVNGSMGPLWSTTLGMGAIQRCYRSLLTFVERHLTGWLPAATRCTDGRFVANFIDCPASPTQLTGQVELDLA